MAREAGPAQRASPDRSRFRGGQTPQCDMPDPGSESQQQVDQRPDLITRLSMPVEQTGTDRVAARTWPSALPWNGMERTSIGGIDPDAPD